jgi:iron complex outermembrane receptor protein
MLLITGSLGSMAALATDLPSEEDFLSAMPVVLSGTRLHQSLHDAPAAITVLDREIIQASGAREVWEVLRLVPGFQIGSESGHVHSITHHGLSDEFSRRMQVLVDGRTIYNPAVGGVDWRDLQLTVDDIERIEVIRGPNAATHGPNAFFGVISIITRHPGVVPQHTLRVNKGNHGITDAWYRFAHRDGPLDYRLTLGRLEDDGFDTRHDSSTVRLASLDTRYQLNLQDRLTLQLGYSEGPRKQGFPDDPISNERTADKRNHFQLLRWQRVENTDDEWSVQFSHNYEKLSETRSPTGFIAYDAGGGTDRYDLELYRTRRHNESLRSVWGLGARRDEFTGEAFLGTSDTFTNDTYRLFGNLEWQLTPAWLMNLGALWEDTDISGTTFSPRLALNYRLHPHQTLRAAVSQAYRTPVYFEQDGDFSIQPLPLNGFEPPPLQLFLGGGNLDPERVRSIELGYIGEFPRTAVTVDLRLYRDELEDLITDVILPPAPPPDTIPPTRTFINEQEATVTGAEAQLHWRPVRHGLLRLAYAWADVDSSSADLVDSTPRHTLSLLGSYRFSERLSGSAAWYYVDDQLWLGAAGDTIPDYDRLDLRLAYRFRFGGKTAELSGVVQNLFDDYHDFRLDPDDPKRRNLFERQAWLSLRLEL